LRKKYKSAAEVIFKRIKMAKMMLVLLALVVSVAGKCNFPMARVQFVCALGQSIRHISKRKMRAAGIHAKMVRIALKC
jgi:hypothetical protein